jgi:hypothetical protein
LSGPEDRIFGLPVYSSKWLGDHVLVPGLYETINEMRERAAMVGNYLIYNGSTLSNSTATTSTLTFSYGENGNVYATSPVITGFPGLPPTVKTPKPESDMAWLKRRVAEVSWVPA